MENLPIRDAVAKKLNTRDKKYGILALVIGVIIMVLSTVYFIANCAKVPTDYKYKGNVRADAYQVETVGDSHFIHYMDSTSAATFRERATSGESASAQFGGATIYREKYSSDTARKSIFIKEKELSAKEVRNKLWLEEAKTISVGWFFGGIVLIMGVVLLVMSKGKNKLRG
ncbi:hypothetical protein [Anaerosporobacter sp.]|uniref:hypothetical protein n=1 Tax=Anaerosporobacter sp. TaxID=1872529 RepID=UPI00286F4613|nr:hypothetical protein [Anaerosporobacter sp.]